VSSLEIRTATETDLVFVVDSWLSSFRTSRYAGTLPKQVYFDAYRAGLAELFARPEVRVLVAHKPGEEPPYDVYGWICAEEAPVPILHYVYVKKPYRSEFRETREGGRLRTRVLRGGIAARLFEAAGLSRAHRFFYTHATPMGSDIINACRLNASHDPWLAREPRRKEAA
jgi:hypothetical protein